MRILPFDPEDFVFMPKRLLQLNTAGINAMLMALYQ